MAHAQQTEFVRCLVAQACPSMGAPSCEDLRESILIRDGIYCGRRFDAEGGGYAIWIADDDEITFYGNDGRVARVIELPSPESVQTRAAA